MKILTIDVGTGTQDIFLYDSRLDLENGFKLILPSPTMIINRQLRQATQRRQPVLLTGVTMGGGPSAWAAENHAKAGLEIFSTPDAARSFNDDLSAVEGMGIKIVSDEEAQKIPSAVLRIELKDIDLDAIYQVFQKFGVSLDDLAAVSIAVFDHGAAPPHVSDRQFRFDYLDERIRAQNRLSAFAYNAHQIPEILTRLKAVARSAANLSVPLIVMDTAPAAILGATFDPVVASRRRKIILNVGNFHTLAFRLGPGGIEGVFEHHTGLLDTGKIERLVTLLAESTLKHEDVFNHHGHGALIYQHQILKLDDPDFNIVVTGPRRSMMAGSSLKPYFAVPFGDMMITGCFGLLAATADLLPELSEPVLASLRGDGGSGTPPWELPVE